MRALPPPPVILTAVSAFERRASAHLLRRPRTGELATSPITRLCAEKAARRNGSVRLDEVQLWDDVLRCRHAQSCASVLVRPRRRMSAATPSDLERTSAVGLNLGSVRPNCIERQYEDRGPTAQRPGKQRQLSVQLSGDTETTRRC
jgi:hypothetical protein